MIATVFIANLIIEQLKEVALDELQDSIKGLGLAEEYVFVFTSSPAGIIDMLYMRSITDFTVDCEGTQTVLTFRCDKPDKVQKLKTSLINKGYRFKVIV